MIRFTATLLLLTASPALASDCPEGCGDGFYTDDATPTDASSGEGALESCDACPSGSTCPAGTLLSTINITRGYWRHSDLTTAVYECVENRGWTPCAGGLNSSAEGDGLCHDGHTGPKCELCRDEDR